jgi:cysteinyl-tRNA synthetase
LLASVPYRNQLNFTFDGLKQAAASVDRLRNFRLRLSTGQFPSGCNPSMTELAREAAEKMKAGMDDDLNTAQAQAAIFDMVRAANAAIDAGQLKKDDVPPLLAAIEKFDEIFSVLQDDDAPKMKSILEWAQAEGREKDISKELQEAVSSQQLTDEDIEKKISDMDQARRARNFKLSDSIRAELTEAGILVEITKDGVRWRRK